LFPHRLFHDPQGLIEALEKVLEVVGKEDHRLALKAAGFLVLAFHNVKVEIAQAVFLHIEKVGSVLQDYPGGKKFTPYTHVLSFCFS
jgi:hypothetical protein